MCHWRTVAQMIYDLLIAKKYIRCILYMFNIKDQLLVYVITDS